MPRPQGDQLNPELPNRRSIRLKGFDYTVAGAFFETVCVKDMRCVFGRVTEGDVQLSPLGRLVRDAWLEIPERFPTVEVDHFVIMPNHG